MQRIRDYVDRFFKEIPENKRYLFKLDDAGAFADEIKSTDSKGLFYAISLLFRYGYVKGYRACKAEQKKARGMV